MDSVDRFIYFELPYFSIDSESVILVVQIHLSWGWVGHAWSLGLLAQKLLDVVYTLRIIRQGF